MVLDTLFRVVVVLGFGGFILLLGLGYLIQGLQNLRRCRLAAYGDETPIETIDTDAEKEVVKLSGTVTDVPESVETLDGDDVGIYHLQVRKKNRWNWFRKYSSVQQVVMEATDLDTIVIQDKWDGDCLVTTRENDDQEWGSEKSAKKDADITVGSDFLPLAWSKTRTFSDWMPDDIADSLRSRHDMDSDFDVSSFAVELRVSQHMIETDDTIRLLGHVRPRETINGPEGTDEGGSAVAIEPLSETVMTDHSWSGLARAQLKRGLFQTPFGLAVTAIFAVLIFQFLQDSGLF